MKCREFITLPILAVLLAWAPTALASNTWYVDGVSGSDSNTCMSSESACKTIGHAISLAASGDSIIVAPATHHETITIAINLNIIGSGARTTIVDGGGKATVVSVSNATANVALSQLTIQNGSPSGIYNLGTLALTNSTVRNNHVYKNCATTVAVSAPVSAMLAWVRLRSAIAPSQTIRFMFTAHPKIIHIYAWPMEGEFPMRAAVIC